MNMKRGCGWTQDFTFETDSIESFEAMFAGALPVVFSRGAVVSACADDRDRMLDQWPSESAAYFLQKYKDHYRYPSADTAIWLGYERGESLLHHAVCQLNGELPPFLTKSDYVPDFGSTISDVMSRITAAPEPDPKGNPFAISDGGGIGYRAHFSSRFGLLVISLCFIYVPK
jgi:hypothetical protein